jgi:uncharacterized membrane protein (GlpM family)
VRGNHIAAAAATAGRRGLALQCGQGLAARVIADAQLLPLALKMAVTAGIVIAAALAAERSGPQLGGVIASLPVSAGPAYVFLAMKSDDAFIAASALGSLGTNAATAIYLLFLAAFAARLPAVLAFGGALTVWTIANAAIRELPATLGVMILVNVVLYAGAIALTRRMRFPVAGGRVAGGRLDLFLRALLVAGLVGGVVTVSDMIGPGLTGVAALFPMTFTSVGLLIHTRLGGGANAAAMASGLVAMIGFTAGLIALQVAAVPLGSAAALVLFVACCLAWSALLLWFRRRRAGAIPARP